jgi:hypothetical protein
LEARKPESEEAATAPLRSAAARRVKTDFELGTQEKGILFMGVWIPFLLSSFPDSIPSPFWFPGFQIQLSPFARPSTRLIGGVLAKRSSPGHKWER